VPLIWAVDWAQTAERKKSNPISASTARRPTKWFMLTSTKLLLLPVTALASGMTVSQDETLAKAGATPLSANVRLPPWRPFSNALRRTGLRPQPRLAPVGQSRAIPAGIES
jgi:hypothetical protein